MPSQSPGPSSALPPSAPKSNYLLRLKKQTNKHNRSDTNDLVDNMTGINSLTQRNHKLVQVERSNSPLLQSEDNLIEVKKCESSCGSKVRNFMVFKLMPSEGRSQAVKHQFENQNSILSTLGGF